MRNTLLLAAALATTIGLGAVSTGSAFAMGCLSPALATPPASLTQNQMGDDSTKGATSTGFGYDRDAYLAAVSKGNYCGTSQQSQPVSDTQQNIRTNHPTYN